ncbi:MAG TPA: hypothetical protein VJW20_18570 [Candidatus Angelobacter sp.]|nr:hypothetical protein [Candidatus Angelobacter sp.]
MKSMLPRLATIGRCFFSITMIVFGLQHCVYAVFRTGLVFGPPWILRSSVFVAVIGIVLVLTGLGIATGYKPSLAGYVLAGLLLLYVVIIYDPRIAANIRNPGNWTSGAELLCMCGAALVTAGMEPRTNTSVQATGPGKAPFAEVSRILYALPLIVFGLQHFMYARFVATLVPAWIPARLFWAYFVGAAFFAASISLMAKIQAFLATALLGLMFFLWVVIVHVPRIALAFHNANEWTSGLVALAMSGGALLLTNDLSNRALRNRGSV